MKTDKIQRQVPALAKIKMATIPLVKIRLTIKTKCKKAIPKEMLIDRHEKMGFLMPTSQPKYLQRAFSKIGRCTSAPWRTTETEIPAIIASGEAVVTRLGWCGTEAGTFICRR